MTCPRCQQQSPPDADSCPLCGAKLAAVCVHCGTEPGKRADIIAVRGEHWMRGGRPLKLDAERILADATQAAGRLTNVGA